MGTMFCTKCTYVFARGDIDPKETLAARICPECGAAAGLYSAEGIGLSPADLTREEIRAELRSGSDRITKFTATRKQSRAPWSEGARLRLTMLVAALIFGGATYWLTLSWVVAIVVGIAGGLIAGLIHARILVARRR